MAQFRTTADILDEILQKAGEPTNGNSPFETLALTYANKVHHAIIGGGNIFNINVDEAWTWARARYPIVLELEPVYSTGAVTCTANDTAITFSSAPSSSLEGWHFQVNGKPTVYKIIGHTAGEAAAVLDSSFVDDSGSYSFRAFKLDYEIFPAYFYVDNFNDKVDFQQTASATLSATLTHGAYTPTNLINHVAAVIDATSSSTYTASYNSVLKRFTLTSNTASGNIFNLLGQSGPNYRRSIMATIGFDCTNYTGAASYTSSYTPNSISRLIEPFKLYDGSRGAPFVYSTDPIKMQEDFPIALTRERIPDRFVRIQEENDGTVWVRFNSYPKYKTKISIDWIPAPMDLQDNTASFVRLPRGDVDALIHGTAGFILLDKEDSKAETMFNLCKSHLEAMQKKNRSALFRTGDAFGQIVPRLDLDARDRRFEYGYTSGSSSIGTTADSTDVLLSVTIPYTSFQGGSTQSTVTARTLPATRSLYSIIAKHSQNFTGALLSAITVDVGITGDATYFLNGFDVAQATAATAQATWVGLYYPAVSAAIQVRMTGTGANLSALGQGSLVLYFQESIVP